LNLTTAVVISLLTGCLFANAVQAQAQSAQAHPAPRSGDVFNRVPETNTGGKSNLSVAQNWFNAFDTTVNAHKPSPEDKVILSRPFNKEAERVEQYRVTAAKVAKNYRELARQLRDMDIPSTLVGVKAYRDLTADWYNDAAGIYEDLIRPKKPAKTIEELDVQLEEIQKRAQGLKQNNTSLAQMDMGIRKTFKVHLNDSLWKYVSGK
jgi:hypothetical protein